MSGIQADETGEEELDVDDEVTMANVVGCGASTDVGCGESGVVGCCCGASDVTEGAFVPLGALMMVGFHRCDVGFDGRTLPTVTELEIVRF
jgi:hypothetical protein